MHAKYILVILALINSSYILKAQQVSADQNIPTSIPTLPSVSSLPGLNDFTSQTYVNFIRKYTVTQPDLHNSGSIHLWIYSNPEFRVQTTYFDGLGRQQQEVVRCGQGVLNDFMKAYSYDANGRQQYEYLPFSKYRPSVRGKLNKTPSTDILAQYDQFYKGDEPYSKKEYDGSPLNVIKKILPEGHDWVGSNRGKEFKHYTNSASDGIRIWAVDIYNFNPITSATYASNELQVAETIDEDGNKTIEYKDKGGKLIMTKRRLDNTPQDAHNGWACTYYVYDLLDRLRCVVPPKAVEYALNNSWTIPANIMDELCYKYRYDNLGRMSEKKLPGKDVEYYLYDKRNRLVLRQDGNLRSVNKWAFTIYDQLDRECITGTYYTTDPKNQLAVYLIDGTTYNKNELFYYLKSDDLTYDISSAENSFFGYPGKPGHDPLPQGTGGAAAITYFVNCEILAHKYYDKKYLDHYTGFFDYLLPFPAYSNPYLYHPEHQKYPKGKMTATFAKIIDPHNVLGRTSPHDWERRHYYYNRFGKLIFEQHPHVEKDPTAFLGSGDFRNYYYDYSGDMVAKFIFHTYINSKSLDPSVPQSSFTGNVSLTETVEKDYESLNVPKEYHTTVNGVGPVKIGNDNYDEFNRKKYENEGPVLNTYTYNIRNWMTGINANNVNTPSQSVYFAEKIYYNNGFQSKDYNGKIAGIEWRHFGANAPKRFYGYTYDNMDRLSHAEFGEWATSSWNKSITDLTASEITYDINGNIGTMQQMGPGANGPLLMDDMTYHYKSNSNKLESVTDNGLTSWAPDFEEDKTQNGIDYKYDANGNINIDMNKGVTNNSNASAIHYNVFNLPERVEIKHNSLGNVYDLFIDYVYDGLGNLLAKKEWLSNAPGSSPYLFRYFDQFTYRDDVLLYFSHKGGRAIPTNQHTPPQPPGTKHFLNFNHEFFAKDHLSNVRAVVGATIVNSNVVADDNTYTNYHLGLELADITVEDPFWSGIDDIRTDRPTLAMPENAKCAELNGGDPVKRSGGAIMLRVMAGDKFELESDCYYEGDPTEAGIQPAEMVVQSLLNMFGGGEGAVNWGTGEVPDNLQMVNNTVANPTFGSAYEQVFNSQTFDPQMPQAYLNYIVFDENFQLVENNSGMFQASGEAGNWSLIGTDNTAVEIGQNGYLLVFLSSRALSKSTFFDDVRLKFMRGALREENHYYPFGLTVKSNSSLIADPRDNKTLFGSKELENTWGQNWYNFGARRYDMQLGRWMGVDPLADKMPTWSPYTFSFNNPIYFTDPDGQEPTPSEAARMAAHVYGDKKNSILTGGWRVSSRDFGVQLQNNNGLKSLVYERVVDGKVTEYTYATAGTEDWTDWKQNGQQLVGLADQYHSSANNAKVISGDLKDMELSFVGHSLGGGEAALNSLITAGDGVGRKAFTFNAAGVGDITKLVEGETPFGSEKNINAYILMTDPLNAVQNNSILMPDVNGKRHYLVPTDLPSLYNGHSIDNILKNFGVSDPSQYNN